MSSCTQAHAATWSGAPHVRHGLADVFVHTPPAVQHSAPSLGPVFLPWYVFLTGSYKFIYLFIYVLFIFLNIIRLYCIFVYNILYKVGMLLYLLYYKYIFILIFVHSFIIYSILYF